MKTIKTDRRKKAFIGAIISGVTSLATAGINYAASRKQAKLEEEQRKAELEEQERKNLYNQASAMNDAYNNQQYVDEYKKRITLKNGGKMKNETVYSDRIKMKKQFACGGRSKKACGGRKKAELGMDNYNNSNTIIDNNSIDRGMSDMYKCGGKRKRK